jgi:antitoxin StbD
MEKIMTEIATSISEFKKNPNEEVRRAGKKAFAVLTNNKPSFYVLSPELYDELMERIWELEMSETLTQRLAARSESIKVDIKDL